MGVSKVALASYTGALKNPEDDLLVEYLQKQNIRAKIEIWDDPLVTWEQYDLVMIKSTWDYFDKVEAFSAWLANMERRKVNLYNPVSLVKWNMDKIYLSDLERAGISTIPSIWLNKGSSFQTDAIMRQFGAEQIVVKPRISGGAKHTFKVTKADGEEMQNKINALLTQEDFMAQPYMSEIETGELSFLFFDGKFSHAIKKVPKENEFRVQLQFGGSVIPFTPEAPLLQQAQEVCNRFARNSMYARVDGIIRNELLYIIELELIEPLLYLAAAPSSFEALTRAIRNKIS
jgi:glutathione synthase/RimK-type ligase-like ATP-grasp enzyme